MALLSIANLELSIGNRPILAGVNLTLDHGEHVGLVGRNGCGKSTLMKLVAGLETHTPEAGHVQLAHGATAGYLTQDPTLDQTRTLRAEAASALAHLERLQEELHQIAHDMGEAQGDDLDRLMKRYEQIERDVEAAGGFQVDHVIDATLHGVGLTDNLFDVLVKDLSGGQKGRLALAKLLLSHPDVLLLDEPTNHLDIAGREWLEGYLADYNGAVLLVSHDRWLLDRVASKIYELSDGKLFEYPGNYHAYREQRALRILELRRVYEKQQERVKSEQAFIDRYRAGQRARQAQGREKRLERYKDQELIERPTELDTMKLSFKPGPRASDIVISAEGVAKGYEGKPLFKDLSITIKRGERYGIIGPNGAGKSTLINCLLGVAEPDAGVVKIGSAVDVGHYRQTHEHLSPQLTLVDYLRPFTHDEKEQSARDLAGAFLFSGLDQDKPLGVLSGGERSRAVLAGLVSGGHNLLVLDEPTNHLDIPSAERLEDALRAFSAERKGFGQSETGGGTLILITHDRMLLDDLVDQLLVLDGNGNIRHFLGTYSAYAAFVKKAAEEEAARVAAKEKGRRPQDRGEKRGGQAPNAGAGRQAPPQPAGQAKPGGPPGGPQAGSPGRDGGRRDGGREKKSPFARLSQEDLDKRIEQIETRLRELDGQLADPVVYKDTNRFRKLEQERNKLAAELVPLEEEWTRRAEG